jgi:hypothetical protein
MPPPILRGVTTDLQGLDVLVAAAGRQAGPGPPEYLYVRTDAD